MATYENREIPKTITAQLDFEVAKLKIENNAIKYKKNKTYKKIIRLTTKYIKKLMKVYVEAKIYVGGVEFKIEDKE